MFEVNDSFDEALDVLELEDDDYGEAYELWRQWRQAEKDLGYADS